MVNTWCPVRCSEEAGAEGRVIWIWVVLYQAEEAKKPETRAWRCHPDAVVILKQLCLPHAQGHL